ncbi:hypothetical protein [Azospirillum sp.]|uniref:hypothetical protein n=1 Tax=Azospirillum sp. TaxID=34012 RepID=UPI00262FBC6F|nr:hypothetical protein [Azospirillum sp.]
MTAKRIWPTIALLAVAMVMTSAPAVAADDEAALVAKIQYALNCAAKTGRPKDIVIAAVEERGEQTLVFGTYTHVPSMSTRLPFKMESVAGFSEFAGTFEAVLSPQYKLLSVRWKVNIASGGVPPQCLH